MRKAHAWRGKGALHHFLLLTLVSVCAQAEELRNPSWENLEKLRVGEKIRIVETSSRARCGRFLDLSEESIVLQIKSNEVLIPRD